MSDQSTFDEAGKLIFAAAEVQEAADALLAEPVSVPSPRVARIVHYVAYGTPGGEFPAGAHRAAVITEISKVQDPGDGNKVSLCVLNPTGFFFNENIPEDQTAHKPGTWHWPERD